MTSSPARAAASRRNGARSRGPVTPEGKARSARNALKHGLRAQQNLLLSDESAADFIGFADKLQAELAPAGTLQAEFAARVTVAAWRARRADRLEAALLARHLEQAGPAGDPRAALGAGLIRDGYGPRALETLVRYRGSVLAELFRGLAALKALQAEAAGRRAADLPPAAQTTLPPWPCEPNGPEDRR